MIASLVKCRPLECHHLELPEIYQAGNNIFLIMQKPSTCIYSINKTVALIAQITVYEHEAIQTPKSENNIGAPLAPK